MQWPDPAQFVDHDMALADKQAVVDYLKAGLFMPYTNAGLSWCRFRCEEKFLGSGEQTDGIYLWPEKLWHYVEAHNVRLPEDFINHTREKKAFPESIGYEYEIKTDWWLSQKGQNTEASSFLTMD